ncbi:uncharacterized protein L203_102815 [Cryptococcus depauperatus CBS 7841]|uniref:Uncharacterized protein n=1 Tax=Cryptococcus depauperatus CBS 7841 TaxID=1295531 RepID=A0A1E3IDB5_9TREE|nr:hypothetical protein L203_04615 [Cryptococcus depauperatus CBS 7841]
MSSVYTFPSSLNSGGSASQSSIFSVPPQPPSSTLSQGTSPSNNNFSSLPFPEGVEKDVELYKAQERYWKAREDCQSVRNKFRRNRKARDKCYKKLSTHTNCHWKTTKMRDLAQQEKNGRILIPWTPMKDLMKWTEADPQTHNEWNVDVWNKRTKDMKTEILKAEYGVRFVTSDINRLTAAIEGCNNQHSIASNSASVYNVGTEASQRHNSHRYGIPETFGYNSCSQQPSAGMNSLGCQSQRIQVC